MGELWPYKNYVTANRKPAIFAPPPHCHHHVFLHNGCQYFGLPLHSPSDVIFERPLSDLMSTMKKKTFPKVSQKCVSFWKSVLGKECIFLYKIKIFQEIWIYKCLRTKSTPRTPYTNKKFFEQTDLLSSWCCFWPVCCLHKTIQEGYSPHTKRDENNAPKYNQNSTKIIQNIIISSPPRFVAQGPFICSSHDQKDEVNIFDFWRFSRKLLEKWRNVKNCFTHPAIWEYFIPTLPLITSIIISLRTEKHLVETVWKENTQTNK